MRLGERSHLPLPFSGNSGAKWAGDLLKTENLLKEALRGMFSVFSLFGPSDEEVPKIEQRSV
jgi:hypothetical protein